MNGNNRTIQVFAALLTIFIWFYVNSGLPLRNEGTQTLSDVPLELRDVPADMQLTNHVPDTVSITLRGPVGVIQQVTRADVSAYLSLTGAREGSGQYVIRVSFPPGLSAVVNPSRVTVQLEQVLSADYELQLPEARVVSDHYLQATTATEFIRATGVRSAIDRAKSATVVLDWAAIRQSMDLQLPIKLLDNQGQEVPQLLAEPGVAQVRVERYPGKTVPIVPTVREDESGEGSDLVVTSLEPATVTIYAPAAVLNTIESVSTEPIDLASFDEPATPTLDLRLPEQVLHASTGQVQVALDLPSE
ncbi:MAG: YbbR-like domain-containing protein [Bacillota bacterium]|jgi:YbbR domain-containing protein